MVGVMGRGSLLLLNSAGLPHLLSQQEHGLTGNFSDLSSISYFKLPLTSSSTALNKLTFTMNGKGPVPSRQDKPHPHSVFPDPTGNFLLSADLGADLIRIFSINSQTGALTACTAAQTGSGDGPRHPAWWAPSANSTTGQMLYIVNELANSVTAWQVSYPSGQCLSLKKVQSLSAYPAGKSAPSGSKSAELHVAGNFLYLANRNDKSFGSQQDSMAVYTIDPSTGLLTWYDFENSYSWYPRTFAINKAGTMVAVGGQTSSNVAVIARNATSGKLGPLIANLMVGTAGHDNSEDGLSAVIWNE
jgi:6-phosphogluconolactonase (cycloisomerase 2 family)